MATNKTSTNNIAPIIVGLLVAGFLAWLIYDTSKLIVQVKAAMTPNAPTELKVR
jgi:uncharacterized protein with PQ loop repeat